MKNEVDVFALYQLLTSVPKKSRTAFLSCMALIRCLCLGSVKWCPGSTSGMWRPSSSHWSKTEWNQHDPSPGTSHRIWRPCSRALSVSTHLSRRITTLLPLDLETLDIMVICKNEHEDYQSKLCVYGNVWPDLNINPSHSEGLRPYDYCR